MIVRPRPHWLRLLFVWHGSIVKKILSQQLFIFFFSSFVVLFHGELLHHKITLTSSPFSLMGVALAIFLGFRINASYDRYWEARKLWGAVLIETRNLARQALTLTERGTEIRPFIMGLSAFTFAMRNQLRGYPRDKDLSGRIPDSLIERVKNARFSPMQIALWLGEHLRVFRDKSGQDPWAAHKMEDNLDRLTAAWGGCERIAVNPLPFTYGVILHRSAYLYCILLPFGLVDAIGFMTPLVVCFVSYTFFALEALSDEIEEPFGTEGNDLALDAMTLTIEASLLEMLGEVAPPALQPDENYILT